jgi:hypothetical protein
VTQSSLAEPPAKIKIYIAGPYTKGDVALNVRKAIFAADYVTATLGHVAYCPHLTHFWHMLIPHENIQFWYDYDIEWLKVCDAILRLEGESHGADEEVRIAESLGMRVYRSVFEIPRHK